MPSSKQNINYKYNKNSTTSTNSNIAKLWKRALALLMDLAIINLVIVYPFRNVFMQYFGNITLKDSFELSSIIFPQSLYFMLIIISILVLLYFTFFDYYLGQTPGKIIMRIRSISIKGDDDSISFYNALLKNCYALPFFPFYIFWMIEPIYLIFYKERFLEKITHTKTIDESEKYRSSNNIKNYDEEYKLEKVK